MWLCCVAGPVGGTTGRVGYGEEGAKSLGREPRDDEGTPSVPSRCTPSMEQKGDIGKV